MSVARFFIVGLKWDGSLVWASVLCTLDRGLSIVLHKLIDVYASTFRAGEFPMLHADRWDRVFELRDHGAIPNPESGRDKILVA